MFQFRPKKYSIQGFRIQMISVFDENASLVSGLIEHSSSGGELNAEFEERLMKSQRTIGELVGYFDFRKQAIAEQFVKFMSLLSPAVDVYKFRARIPKFRKNWYEAADSVCRVVHEMNQWNIRAMLYQQIISMESIIISCIKSDPKAHQYALSKLIDNNRAMADVLVLGIISDNKEKFI